MKKINHFLLLVFFLIFLAASNEKGKDELIKEAVCPKCGLKFKVITILKPDGRGGEDTDFLVRSLNGNPYSYIIWTCPRCYFSAGNEEFSKKLNEKAKNINFIKAEIKKEPNQISQKEIPDWIKYENAIKYYKAIGMDNQSLAGLYLKASWVVRLDYFNYTPEMEKISQQVWAETKKADGIPFFVYYQNMAMIIEEKIKNNIVKEEELPLWRLVQADYLRKSGNHLASYEILNKLKLNPIYKTYSSQIEKSLFLCRKEKEYQQQAFLLFSEDFKNNKVVKEKKNVIAYLIGELARRMGNKKEAVDWFKKSLNFMPKDFPLRNLVEQQLKFLENPSLK